MFAPLHHRWDFRDRWQSESATGADVYSSLDCPLLASKSPAGRVRRPELGAPAAPHGLFQTLLNICTGRLALTACERIANQNPRFSLQNKDMGYPRWGSISLAENG
jgi:hypothetical protein